MNVYPRCTERHLKRGRDRQTERQTEIDRQTDRGRDRQTAGFERTIGVWRGLRGWSAGRRGREGGVGGWGEGGGGIALNPLAFRTFALSPSVWQHV